MADSSSPNNGRSGGGRRGPDRNGWSSKSGGRGGWNSKSGGRRGDGPYRGDRGRRWDDDRKSRRRGDSERAWRDDRSSRRDFRGDRRWDKDRQDGRRDFRKDGRKDGHRSGNRDDRCGKDDAVNPTHTQAYDEPMAPLDFDEKALPASVRAELRGVPTEPAHIIEGPL